MHPPRREGDAGGNVSPPRYFPNGRVSDRICPFSWPMVGLVSQLAVFFNHRSLGSAHPIRLARRPANFRANSSGHWLQRRTNLAASQNGGGK